MLIMIRGGSLAPPTVHHHHRTVVVVVVFLQRMASMFTAFFDPIHVLYHLLPRTDDETLLQTLRPSQKVYAVCMPKQSKVFLSEPTWGVPSA